jgi:hypothetical protein
LGNLSRPACLALLIGSSATIAAFPKADLQVEIAGGALPGRLHPRVTVDLRQGLPDEARIALTGPHATRFASRIRPGDDVVVDVAEGRETTSLFKGEVVGIEPLPLYQPFIVVHAASRLLRLTHERKTRTFSDVTSAQIVEMIAAEHGLQAGATSDPDIHYDHLFQHNQSDLDFLKALAREADLEVAIDGFTLFLRRADDDPPLLAVSRRPFADERLQVFHPQLSASQSLQRLVITGPNPDRTGIFTGEAQSPSILLGSRDDDPTRVLGRTATINLDHTLASQAEADEQARQLFLDLTAGRIAAELLTRGNPTITPGILVDIDVGSPFDGKYFVAGVSHRFGEGGYEAVLRVRRSDNGMFFLPEIDDEVLVSFAQGNVHRPVVVGSLWDEDDPTRPACRRCDR